MFARRILLNLRGDETNSISLLESNNHGFHYSSPAGFRPLGPSSMGASGTMRSLLFFGLSVRLRWSGINPLNSQMSLQF